MGAVKDSQGSVGCHGARGVRAGRAVRARLRVVLAAALAVGGAPAVVRGVAYSFDVNGLTLGYGVTAGSSYAWNGTNAFFSTDTSNDGTTGAFVADFAATPATGGADQVTFFGDTRITTAGSYTLALSGSRWLQRMDVNLAGAFSTSATLTVAGTGASPALNLVAQASGISFVNTAGLGGSTTTFDGALTLRAYGPLTVLSAATGKQLNVNGTLQRFDRGVLQVNNSGLGNVNIAASNTSVSNTNGAILNGIWLTPEVIGANATNFAARGAGNLIGQIGGQVAVTANLANMTNATGNYTANLNVNTISTISGTSNTATATYTFTAPANLSANTLRLFHSGFVSGSNYTAADTGGYTIDFSGRTVSLNSLLSVQQPLLLRGSAGAALRANAGGELTILASRNVTISVPIVNNTVPTNLTLAATTANRTFTITSTSTYTGSTFVVGSTVVGSGTTSLGAGIAANGAEIVLNQGVLRTLGSGTYTQSLRTSATTVNTLEGGGLTNTYSVSRVTLDLHSRLTLANGRYTLPGGVTFTASGSNQLTLANEAWLTVTGLTGDGQLYFGTPNTGTFTGTSVVSGPAGAFTGVLGHRTGTVTYDATFNPPVVGGFSQNNATVNVFGTITLQQAALQDYTVGDQTGAGPVGTLNVRAGGVVQVLGATASKRPVAIGNGQGTTASGLVTVDGVLSFDAEVDVIGIGGNPFRTDQQTTGQITVNSGGTFSVAGAESSPKIYLGVNGQTTGVVVAPAVAGLQSGTVVVNAGGLLRTSRQITTGVAGTGLNAAISSSLRLNGGTLQAFPGQPNTDWVTGLTRFSVTNAGGIIDTNGQDMTMSQPIVNDLVGGTVPATGGLTKAGTGTLTLTGALTFSGSVAVTGGTLTVTRPVVGGAAGVAGLTVGAGTAFSVAVPDYAEAGNRVAINAGYISVAATGRVSIGAVDRSSVETNTATPNHGVVVTSGLSLASTVAGYEAYLDLNNNDMIIRGGTSHLSALRFMVLSWLTTGDEGLGSSLASPAAAPYTTLAVFPNSTRGAAVYTTYDNVSALTANDVIVKYTYLGDTNVDGKLTAADLSNAIEGYSLGLSGWENGDLDYSGGPVDAADISKLLTALAWYNAQASPPNYGNGADAGGGPTSGAIPEPSGLVPVSALAAVVLGHRRRRQLGATAAAAARS